MNPLTDNKGRAAEFVWNPWHGCKKYSDGCKNCYVYRRDERVGRDSSVLSKNKSFALPLAADRHGNYKIPAGSSVYISMTSDFFIDHPLAEVWRREVWDIVRKRPELSFTIITKRIVRFMQCIPDDWGGGYPNVTVCCTMENQAVCDTRLPVLLSLPIKHKCIVCEPLLSDIDFHGNLSGIEKLVAGGESGDTARECRYEWILHLRDQCTQAGVPFYFKQTGANFVKDGIRYRVPRRLQHTQARKAGINTCDIFGTAAHFGISFDSESTPEKPNNGNSL